MCMLYIYMYILCVVRFLYTYAQKGAPCVQSKTRTPEKAGVRPARTIRGVHYSEWCLESLFRRLK